MGTYNCEPFVFLPLLAIDNSPAEECVKFGFISSMNGSSQYDSPPLPVPVGSPPMFQRSNNEIPTYFFKRQSLIPIG